MRQIVLAANYWQYRLFIKVNDLDERDFVYVNSYDKARGYKSGINVIGLPSWSEGYSLGDIFNLTTRFNVALWEGEL